jgi:U5 small nuclear ribonucleoprotein component
MQVDKKKLGQIKEYIRQGFQWGAKEGPLCDERVCSLNPIHIRLLTVTVQRCEE